MSAGEATKHLAALKISFVLPAYNEERGIAEVVRGLLRKAEDLRLPSHVYEGIVVDDGSTDGTPQGFRI